MFQPIAPVLKYRSKGTKIRNEIGVSRTGAGVPPNDENTEIAA